MARRSDQWTLARASRALGGDRQHLLNGQIRVNRCQTVQDILLAVTPSRSVFLGKHWRENVSRGERSTRRKVRFLVRQCTDIAQERRVQRVAQAKLARIPGLVLWTTTEVLLNERGPLAPIWSLGISPNGQVASPSGSFRQRVFDMLREKEVT